MTHIIDVQLAVDRAAIPAKEQLALWANAALQDVDTPSELTIRIVDETEAAQLNEKWRKKIGPTNVLSFPAHVAEEIQPRLLGDIVICAAVVAREAAQQDKLLNAHWAHMVIHGTLHLLGYDHTEVQQSETMESLEINILNKLNIGNPYA